MAQDIGQHFHEKAVADDIGAGDSTILKCRSKLVSLDKAKQAVDNALVGSPATIREKLWQFQKSHVDQVILLNQAGKTSHQDICDSLEMFAKEVMPEFQAAEPEHQAWKQDVLEGKIVLDDLDTEPYDLYSHQNEDIVRMTPEQLKAMMAAKETQLAAAGACLLYTSPSPRDS